jgi:hypothetical protein
MKMDYETRLKARKAAGRTMSCHAADGSFLDVRNVPVYARFSQQAAADHKAADKAKAELGDKLDNVVVGTIRLHFVNGKSVFKELLK